MEFGQKLKEARQKAGLTQENVAQTIGVSRQSLSNWENDRTYPDLGSVLKLSDLYGLSLDDLLRDDMELRRKLEGQKERTRRIASLCHDFAMLLICCTILAAWMEATGVGIALGAVGILLICGSHFLFVLRLGADWKNTAFQCLATVMWFFGFMLRIFSNHTSGWGDALFYFGLILYWVGAGRGKWNTEYPRRMTVFTGFVIALVLVFGTVPIIGDSIQRGGHSEVNPFNSRNYRVAEVMQGDAEKLPMVYLGSANSVYLDYPGQEQTRLEGAFTYITQPEGSKYLGVWEMIPREQENILYRIAVEQDGTVTMERRQEEQVQWKYRLEPAPTMGCTIQDVLGSVVGSAQWYYAGSFDEDAHLGSMPLRGKGTIKLSVPGDSPTVTIYEEYRDGDREEYRTMTLTKDERGYVEFYRETNQQGGKQTGIYRVPYEDGEFVLVLKIAK